MWNDFGGMAYRGEICTRRSLGVDAVSRKLFPNFLNLCEVIQYRLFAGIAQILLLYTVPTQLCPLEQVFLTKIDRLGLYS